MKAKWFHMATIWATRASNWFHRALAVMFPPPRQEPEHVWVRPNLNQLPRNMRRSGGCNGSF